MKKDRLLRKMREVISISSIFLQVAGLLVLVGWLFDREDTQLLFTIPRVISDNFDFIPTTLAGGDILIPRQQVAYSLFLVISVSLIVSVVYFAVPDKVSLTGKFFSRFSSLISSSLVALRWFGRSDMILDLKLLTLVKKSDVLEKRDTFLSIFQDTFMTTTSSKNPDIPREAILEASKEAVEKHVQDLDGGNVFLKCGIDHTSQLARELGKTNGEAYSTTVQLANSSVETIVQASQENWLPGVGLYIVAAALMGVGTILVVYGWWLGMDSLLNVPGPVGAATEIATNALVGEGVEAIGVAVVDLATAPTTQQLEDMNERLSRVEGMIPQGMDRIASVEGSVENKINAERMLLNAVDSRMRNAFADVFTRFRMITEGTDERFLKVEGRVDIAENKITEAAGGTTQAVTDAVDSVSVDGTTQTETTLVDDVMALTTHNTNTQTLTGLLNEAVIKVELDQEDTQARVVVLQEQVHTLQEKMRTLHRQFDTMLGLDEENLPKQDGDLVSVHYSTGSFRILKELTGSYGM